MSKETIARDYANDLIFELEKAMWDERGKGGRFRLTTLGREFYRAKCRPKLQGRPDIEGIVATVLATLKENGITETLKVEQDGRLLKLRIGGCLHRPVEERMMARETKPFACVPANLVVLAIDEVLNRPAELAELKLEAGCCQALLVLFDERTT